MACCLRLPFSLYNMASTERLAERRERAELLGSGGTAPELDRNGIRGDRVPRAELAKIFEGFPSCSKSHVTPAFLPPLYQGNSSRDHNREEKRINGLSVFVGDIEHRSAESKIEISQETDSDCKNWCKSIWSSTKRRRVRSGPVFYRKGEKVLFNFQHFVKPEKIVEEYARVNIYNKPRLVKINKRESPPVSSKSASFVHDKRNVPTSEVDPRRSRSKCEKTRANAADVTEERIPGWRLKKSAEAAPRRARRVPKRISATHNFVYEFDPFASSSSVSNNNNNATRGRNASSSAGPLPADASAKCAGDKQNSGNAQTRGTTALPKLNPSDATVAGERKPSGGEINREVEKVKSDWRALRAEGPRWTEGKNYANARTRKLYDTLERMTQEIDKLQRSYLNPTSNQFLHRSAVKALDRPPVGMTFEEKAEKIKEMLFSRAPRKIVDEAFKNASTGDHLKNDLPRETSSKDVQRRSAPGRRSEFLFDAQTASKGKLCAKSADPLEGANAIDRMQRKNINIDIEQYLERYIGEAEGKNLVNVGEKSKTELNVSPEDVASMLKKLNMSSFDVFEIGGNDDQEPEENSPLPGREKLRGSSSSGRKQNCPRATVDRKVGSARIREQPTTLRKNDRNSDTSIQTAAKTNYEENAFMEMGLRATLGQDVPRNAMSRVLRSEFLKKDASLKPM